MLRAAQEGNTDEVQRLIDQGTDVNAKGDYGWIALHEAAYEGHEATVRVLLDNGAHVDAEGNDGWTPLHCAAANGHPATAQVLLDNGAQVDAEADDGNTALHCAAINDHQATVRVLLDNGAQVDAKDKNGKTALDYARSDAMRHILTTNSRANSTARSKLAEMLRLNPHFPVDELQLLPVVIETGATGTSKFSAASTTVEHIHCTLGSSKCLAAYTQHVPPAFQSLKRVTVVAGGSADIPTLLKNLLNVFNGRGPAHTLTLESASNELVCAVVEAQMPLARLVLVKCHGLDLDLLLPLVAENKELEELCVGKGEKCAFSIDLDINIESRLQNTLDLVRQCSHVAFLGTNAELSLPPPKMAAKLTAQAKPLQEAMKLTVFNALEDAPIGLLTAYGQVVPLARNLVPRSQVLMGMLSEGEAEGENLVPMELDPPVGKESVALAVHFISHYVSEDVHARSVEAEAAGKGSFTWCAAFDQFRTLCIQQRFATSDRRLQILCELMALAVFLDCSSLKHFLRVALVLEEF